MTDFISCANCRFESAYSRCQHPETRNHDPVEGYTYRTCRNAYQDCRHTLWEPRPTLMDRLGDLLLRLLSVRLRLHSGRKKDTLSG